MDRVDPGVRSPPELSKGRERRTSKGRRKVREGAQKLPGKWKKKKKGGAGNGPDDIPDQLQKQRREQRGSSLAVLSTGGPKGKGSVVKRAWPKKEGGEGRFEVT